MSVQMKRMQDANEGRKWRQYLPWLWLALALVWFFSFALLDHARGRTWASAFGFPIDVRFLAEFVGGFGIPLFMTMAILRYAKRLSSSREKTVLVRIGWALYAFLFVWELIKLFYLRPFG